MNSSCTGIEEDGRIVDLNARGSVPTLMQLSCFALAAHAPIRTEEEFCVTDDEWYEGIPAHLQK
jgi:hypothetical protein